jgi:uncharacterized protein (DUF1015 family)
MVKIFPFRPYVPNRPAEFCTNPYDVIEADEEKELKKNPNSLVHMILPDGEGEAKYTRAAAELARFKNHNLIRRLDKPGIFLYRQESPAFSQQGFILTVSLQDYEVNRVVKHEKTREKPLQDRTKHISAIHLAPGLVWTVYKANAQLTELQNAITKKAPLFTFPEYGYTNTVWYETDPAIISKAQAIMDPLLLYIADGHHRAASAAQYRKNKIANKEGGETGPEPWQNLLIYAASDDQVRILPYNRVIRKLPMTQTDFLTKIGADFSVKKQSRAFNPHQKHQIAMCLKDGWYLLEPKQTAGLSPVDALDVSILQQKLLDPILGIKDPRSDENIFFVGGVQDPKKMEEFIVKEGNAIFFNLVPVDIRDLEAIADQGGVMPPKSTWFDPKLLSGMTMYPLNE